MKLKESTIKDFAEALGDGADKAISAFVALALFIVAFSGTRSKK